jgi:hypothetical protein
VRAWQPLCLIVASIRVGLGVRKAHIHGMANPSAESVMTFLFFAAVAAIAAAVMLGYVAHFEFGFSRQEIRTPAVIAAAIIGVLLATEYFGRKLRKPK